jgi:hypothetical protein
VSAPLWALTGQLLSRFEVSQAQRKKGIYSYPLPLSPQLERVYRIDALSLARVDT